MADPEIKHQDTPQGQGDVIEGERGIAAITAESGGAKLTESHKKMIGVALLAFVGVMAYSQFGGETPPPVEEQPQTQAARIRADSNFQPAEITDPQPPAPTLAEAPAQAPVGPIEAARAEAAMPAGPTEAELLYQSSIRAPLMAFEGQAASNDITPITGQTPQGSSMFGGSPASGTSAPANGGGLAAQLVTGDMDGSKATRLANPHLTITQGTSIPCTLDTAMDSTAPGLVRCTVNDDVYSTTGSVILMERGTRIVGEYQGGMQRGRARMFVIWTRAETPSGVIVQLGSPAADGLGRSGFSGDIDTQFWTRFGGTLMLSIIDTALVAAAQQNSNAETTTNNISSLAETELNSTINIPVIMTKNQGEEVSVMLARDLDFSGVYRLR